jgi:hypothetical protein
MEVFEGLGEMARGWGRDKGRRAGFYRAPVRRADFGASLWPIELLGFFATGLPVKLWSEHSIPKMEGRFWKRRDLAVAGSLAH